MDNETKTRALEDLQKLIERLLRDDYGVRIKSLPIELHEVLSPRYVALPFTLAAGEIIEKVERRLREVALACHAENVTLERDARGIWIILPRRKPEEVLLRDHLLNRPERPGVAALGVDLHNRPVAIDLCAGPHTLIIGTSNAGKSNTLLALILSQAYWWAPHRVQFYLFDGKGGPSFAQLDNHPIKHQRGEVIREPRKMLAALDDAIAIMKRRYERGGGNNGRTILLICIDELAEVLRMGGDLLESRLSTILQKGRAASIHVVATAPKADTTHLHTLPSFFNSRIVMKTVRPSDAYLAANTSSQANNLNLRGDMYVGPEQRRVQGFKVLPDDVPHLLAKHIIPKADQKRNGTWYAEGGNGYHGDNEEGENTVWGDGTMVETNLDDLLEASKPAIGKKRTGRPAKPISDTEYRALKAFIAAEGRLPTLSELVKGKFGQHSAVVSVLRDDERYTLGLMGRGCMSQGRAQRLLELIQSKGEEK